MCTLNPLPLHPDEGKSVENPGKKDEEKVFNCIKDNNGLLNLDALERLSGVPWRGGRLSDALYGLDQMQQRIRQDSRDITNCHFWVVE